MDIAVLGGAIESIRALAGITKATAEAISDEKHRAALWEIRQGLMDLQERVLQDQLSRLNLVNDLDAVKKELEALKLERAKLADYELVAVAPGRHVYRSKSAAIEHFCCPSCRDAHGRIGVLQVQSGYGDDGRETNYQCSVCSFNIFA